MDSHQLGGANKPGYWNPAKTDKCVIYVGKKENKYQYQESAWKLSAVKHTETVFKVTSPFPRRTKNFHF